MKRTLVVAVAVVALGACSSDGSDSTATSNPTTTQPAASAGAGPACTLVGQADADAFFGGPAMQMQSTGADAASTCIWTIDEAGAPGPIMQVSSFDDESHYAIKDFAKAKPVEGLGEKAFVATDRAGATIDVQFVKDGKTFTVNYVVPNVVNTSQGATTNDRTDDLVALIKANATRV
jgi:hypothetical protein